MEPNDTLSDDPQSSDVASHDAASGESLFQLSIGSRFDNIELVQIVLADCLERVGVDEDARHWIDVAVREAVANAIKHGNRQDADKKVEVGLALVQERELVIRIHDQGEGFDLETLDNPLDPQNLLKASGRGIFYMNSFMDRVDYSARRNGGTCVTLRKRIDGPQPNEEESA